MFDKQLKEFVLAIGYEVGYEVDNDGQLLIYTGLYEHSDGTVHETPEADSKTRTIVCNSRTWVVDQKTVLQVTENKVEKDD